MADPFLFRLFQEVGGDTVKTLISRPWATFHPKEIKEVKQWGKWRDKKDLLELLI